MKMNAILIETTDILEYKNLYFADVSKVVFNGKLFGYKYSDKPAKEEWFTIFFDSNFECCFELPEGALFGEDCIYCHSIEVVNTLCWLISDMFVS
jgi:hypothetical protein